MADQVISNQQTILSTQVKNFLANQDKLDAVLSNQETIVANQAAILANQTKFWEQSDTVRWLMTKGPAVLNEPGLFQSAI